MSDTAEISTGSAEIPQPQQPFMVKLGHVKQVFEAYEKLRSNDQLKTIDSNNGLDTFSAPGTTIQNLPRSIKLPASLLSAIFTSGENSILPVRELVLSALQQEFSTTAGSILRLEDLDQSQATAGLTEFQLQIQYFTWLKPQFQKLHGKSDKIEKSFAALRSIQSKIQKNTRHVPEEYKQSMQAIRQNLVQAFDFLAH